MIAQLIKNQNFVSELSLANLRSLRMVVFELKVLDYALIAVIEPGIFGNIGMPKCPSTQNLNSFIAPV